MANELKINLIVNDDGTAVIKNFSDKASDNLKKVENSGKSMKDGFAQTWQGMATGLNQGMQLFQQLTGYVKPMIDAYMASETATMKLGIALANQGDYSREALRDMEEFAEMMQETTTVEDDLAKSIMGTMKSFGMSTEEVKRSTKAAADMASFTGKSIETVSELLGKAYAGNTAALGKYGIVIDDTIPKSEQFGAVLKQLEQRFGGSAQAELNTYAGQWKQLGNQWGDIQEFMGLVFLKTIQGLQVAAGMVGIAFMSMGSKILQVFDFLMTPVKGLLMTIGLVASAVGADGLSSAMDLAANAISAARTRILESKESMMSWTSKQYEAMVSTDNVTKALDKMGNKTKANTKITEDDAKAAKKAAEEKEKALKKITNDLKSFAHKAEEIGLSQYEKDIKWINDQVAAYQKAGGVKKDISVQINAAIAAADAKMHEETTKLALEDFDAWLKLEDDKAKEIKKNAKEAAEIAKERSEAERKIYEDVRGYETEAYDASIVLINDQAAKYKALGVDKVAVEAWVTEETRKANLQKAAHSDSFFAGFKAQLADAQSKQYTWGQAGIDVAKGMTDAMKSSFSSFFNDAFNGELKTAGDYFKAFGDSMKSTFAKVLSEMVTRAALSSINMSFGATWTSGAQAVLGAVGKVLGYAADWFFGTDSEYGYADGGPVPGYAQYPGNHPGNDKVPAMLSPGEYVMPRTAVNTETVGALEYMRATGKKPRGFAEGGYVDLYQWGPYHNGAHDEALERCNQQKAYNTIIEIVKNQGENAVFTPDLWPYLEGAKKQLEEQQKNNLINQYRTFADSAIVNYNSAYNNLVKGDASDANYQKIIQHAKEYEAAQKKYIELTPSSNDSMRLAALDSYMAQTIKPADFYAKKSIDEYIAFSSNYNSLWASRSFSYIQHVPGLLNDLFEAQQYVNMVRNSGVSLLPWMQTAFDSLLSLNNIKKSTPNGTIYYSTGQSTTFYPSNYESLPDFGYFAGDLVNGYYGEISRQNDSGSGFGGVLGGIASILTGGISDLLQGNALGTGIFQSGILDNELGDWLGVITGGVSTGITAIGSDDPLGGVIKSLTDVIDNPLVNFSDELLTRMGTSPQQALNWLGLIPDDVFEQNYDWTMKIAHMVGAMYAADAAEGWLGDMVMPGALGVGEAAAETGIAATGIGSGTAVAGAIARKILINEALKYAGELFADDPRNGTLGISFNGISGGEGLGTAIKDFPGKQGGTFSIPSASTGIDYIPRDNYLVNTHEEEAILNKKDARAWRGGINSNDSAAELQALRQEMAELKASNYLIAKYTGKMVKILDQFNVDGLPAERPA